MLPISIKAFRNIKTQSTLDQLNWSYINSAKILPYDRRFEEFPGRSFDKGWREKSQGIKELSHLGFSVNARGHTHHVWSLLFKVNP